MPEGHTLHRLARDLAELVGPPVGATSPQGRFPAEKVDGQRLAGVDAYGKHLIADVATGDSVHVHLGMRGKWLRFAPVTGPGLPQVRLRLAVPEVAWDLIAPSTCELLDAVGRARLVGGLGPDPLRPDGDPEEAFRRVTAHPGSIAAALLDQGRIAGVGNVFRAEALFVHGIHPETPIPQVSREQFDALWATLTRMLQVGVKEGRIMTVDEREFGLTRRHLNRENGRYVYRQEACLRCGTPVRRWDMAGRWSYACETCQPREISEH